MTNDSVLLDQYSRTRDAEAFTELVKRYANLVYGTCLRITGNPDDAEDLTQECFMEMARRADKIRTSLPGWLHQTAKNRSINSIRKAAARRSCENQITNLENEENPPDWEDLAPYVDEALENLPEDLKIPVVLHYLNGKSQTEVAGELNINQSTVSRRLEKGIDKLRAGLKKAGVCVSAGILSSMLTENAVGQIPSVLSQSLGKMAIAGVGKSAGAGGIESAITTAAAVKGGAVVLSAKIKMMISIAVCLLIAAGIFVCIKSLKPFLPVAYNLSGIEEPERGKNMLTELNQSPAWITYMGCLKGCVDFLEMDISASWLYGASGHAFIICVRDDLCPSSVTNWHTDEISRLCGNIGIQCDITTAYRPEKDFRLKQKQAYDRVREAIDSGKACFGWELSIPEYSVIHGYNDGQYIYRDIFEGDGKKDWDALGETEISVLAVYIVSSAKPVDDRKTVKEALEFAVNYAGESGEGSSIFHIEPRFKIGPEAYDLWIAALEADDAEDMDGSYNAQCWAECRRHAVGFLKEAGGRLGPEYNGLFDEAIKQYEIISSNLGEVAELFPFKSSGDQSGMEDRVKEKDRYKKAIEALTTARDAEKAGIKVLAEIAARL